MDLELKTTRLSLRPFRREDGPRVRELAGVWSVAGMVGSIPHPYPEGLAESWIGLHDELRRSGRGYPFAATLNGELIGSFGIENGGDDALELGYWLGLPYWGYGYATEAAGALLSFAFGWLGKESICAGHIVDNQASTRVLTKLGFRPIGRRVRSSRTRGQVECVELSLKREDYLAKIGINTP